jgi:sugar lactone lactonase YvrE
VALSSHFRTIALMPAIGLLIATILLSWPLAAATWNVRTVAGPLNGGGYADGVGAEARLSAPAGITICGGFAYFADSGNHVIRRVEQDGRVNTWAGRPRDAGRDDGARLVARFHSPSGIASASDCTLYVADTANDAVRIISPDGTVSTLSADVSRPRDVAVDNSGRVFAIDGVKRVVRAIAPDGTAATVVDQLADPRGLAMDSDGSLLVIDFQGRAIKRRAPSGTVTTLSQNTGFAMDAAPHPDGTLHFTDHWGQTVRRLTSDGTVSVVAGANGDAGVRDGVGDSARFDYPLGIAIAGDGASLVSDFRGCALRRVSLSGAVTTIAGSAPERAVIDGDAASTRFRNPVDIAVGAGGTVFVADAGRIRKTLPDGTTTTIAAGLNTISAIALAPNGDLIVAEGDAHLIRRVTTDGVITTVAGAAGQEGLRDGPGGEARFRYPYGVAVAADGTIFVADTLNRVVRTIVGNEVRTIPHAAGLFNTPVSIETDDQNNAYVWDENLATLTRITPSGGASVLASGPLAGDGWGLARASDGTFYLAANASDAIRRIVPGQAIDIFAGGDDSPGNENGPALIARFRNPRGIAVGPDGAIYIADTGNGALRVITRQDQRRGPRRRAVGR